MYIQRQVVKFLEYEEQKEIVEKINRLFQERNMRAFFKRNKLFKVKIELLSDQYENFFLRVSFHINQNENRLRRTTTEDFNMKTDAFYRLAIGGHLMPMDPLCNRYLDECTKQALNGELPPRAIDLKNKAEKILVVCARFKALLASNTKFTDELFNTLLDEVENADPTGAFASHQVNGRTVNEQRNNLFVDVIGLDDGFTDDFDEDDDDAQMNVEYLEELHVYTGVRVDFAQYVSTYGDDLRLIVHIGD
jgi:hypothetical protein